MTSVARFARARTMCACRRCPASFYTIICLLLPGARVNLDPANGRVRGAVCEPQGDVENNEGAQEDTACEPGQ